MLRALTYLLTCAVSRNTLHVLHHTPGPFLAYWMKLYLLEEKQPATDMLYGSGATSLCHYAKMAECDLVPK